MLISDVLKFLSQVGNTMHRWGPIGRYKVPTHVHRERGQQRTRFQGLDGQPTEVSLVESPAARVPPFSSESGSSLDRISGKHDGSPQRSGLVAPVSWPGLFASHTSPKRKRGISWGLPSLARRASVNTLFAVP